MHVEDAHVRRECPGVERVDSSRAPMARSVSRVLGRWGLGGSSTGIQGGGRPSRGHSDMLRLGACGPCAHP
eukprot:8933179-Alexandrium_andersonii.AAC.1